MKIPSFLLSVVLFVFLTAGGARAHDDVQGLLDGYSALQLELASDLFKETLDEAKGLEFDIKHWLEEVPDVHPKRPAVEKMAEGARALLALSPKEEEKIRTTFELLANGVIALIRTDEALKANWQLYYCPMGKKYWTQPKTVKLMNPYMGTAMPNCGGKKPW